MIAYIKRYCGDSNELC